MTSLDVSDLLRSERERCAQLADAVAKDALSLGALAAQIDVSTSESLVQYGRVLAAQQVAKAIRALTDGGA